MSTGMVGLDPADCRDLVKILKNSAQQLEMTSGHLNQAVARTTWAGPDSQRFRAQWPASRQLLHRSVHDLEDAAARLLQQIAEQERASSAHDMGGGGSGGDGGGSLWDDIVQGGKDLWDNVTEGVGNVAERISGSINNGLDWLGQQVDIRSIDKELSTFSGHFDHLQGLTQQMLQGNPPSLAGLVAADILAAGSSISAGLSILSGDHLNLNFFHDGQPYAGEPQPVTNASTKKLRLPESVSSIFGSVDDAYGMGLEPGTEDGVARIVKVEHENGPPSYIVNIPGTENWGANGSGQGRDLTSNLMVMSGQSSSAQEAVELAMERTGIPPGATVMLAGHSQGGMLAVSLASDPDFMDKYHVMNLVTAGSPVDGTSLDPNVRMLEVQHTPDIVPKVNLGRLTTVLSMSQTPPNVTVVMMDDPPRDTLGNILHYAPSPLGNVVQEVRDIVGNHATESYVVDMDDTAKYPDIGTYQQDESMNIFLSSEGTKVTAVDVPVGRR